LVYELSAHGYSISYVTMDTWQSVDALQHFKKKGYRAEHLSVDTKMDPYENLKSAFYEDRVRVYDYPQLFKELRQLEKDDKKKKIDHPVKGSKDVADALAGCLYSLTQRQGQQPLPVLRGVSYYPDVWMEEHLQQAAARQNGSDPSRFYPTDLREIPGTTAGGLLPPFLGGPSRKPPNWND
jgi:hypothetical protein